MSKKIFSVINQKGGVGKTTTTVNLGTAMAACDAKVLLIDMDPQGNLSTGLGVSPANRSVGIYDILSSRKKLNECIINSEIPNLDIVTANENLLGVEIELSSDEGRAVKLRESLNNTFSDQKDYDFILLDCPPALNIITLNALAASDGAIVPLQAEFYALEGLSQLLKTIDGISSTKGAEWDPRFPMPSYVSQSIQAGIDHTYDEFVSTGSATQTWSTSTTSWQNVYGPGYSAGQNYVELTGQSTGSWVNTWPCNIQISPVRTSEIKTTAVNSPNGLGHQNLRKDPPTFTAGLNWDLGTGNAIQGSTIFGQTGDESWTTVYGPGANFTAQNFMETTSNSNGLVVDPGNPDPQNKSGMMGFHFYYEGVLRAINPYGRNGPSYENGEWNYWGCYRFRGGNQLPGTSDIAVEFIAGSGDLKVTGTGFAQIDFNFEWLDSSSNGYALGTVSWQIGGQTVSFTQNQWQTAGQDLSAVSYTHLTLPTS